MKQSVLLIFFLLLLFSTQAGIISVALSSIETSSTPVNDFEKLMNTADAQTFISLTPSKILQLTGKKMNVAEKLYFKLMQKKVKRQLQKGRISERDLVLKEWKKGDNFNWGAYALGALLGPIGVVIVYLSNYDDPEVARKSAWRGLITWVLIAAAVATLIAGAY